MAPLVSLDLFSGTGGITRALEGLCKPMAYCEIDPHCQEVLKARMADGSLPKAPIYSDVTLVGVTPTPHSSLVGVPRAPFHLRAPDSNKQQGGHHKNKKGHAWGRNPTTKASSVAWGRNPTIIVGGWPCQDLSSIGHKKGMIHGARSGLIKEVFRLTDELQPDALFLENVPMVLKNGFHILLNEFVKRRKYDMRWAVIPASAVGAPHNRKRWFCLLTKPGFKHTWTAQELSKYKPFYPQWKREDPRRRNVPTPSHKALKEALKRRVGMMGNSVVPDAVRAAFITLVRGLNHTPSLSVNSDLRFQILTMGTTQNGDYPKWGFATPSDSGEGYVVWGLPVPKMKRPKLNLVFDPSTFSRPVTGNLSREIFKTPQKHDAWSTPRHSSIVANVLTERTIRDLPTQVRFERRTPDHLRGGVLNPQFVEWMMGFPRDWTRGFRPPTTEPV